VILFFLDTIINACYPLIVYSYHIKKPIGFFYALKNILKNKRKFLPPILVASVIGILLPFPLILFLTETIASGDIFLSAIVAVLILTIIFLVGIGINFVYPIATIGGKGMKSIPISFKSGLKNFRPLSFGIIPFILSVVTALLAVDFFSFESGIISLTGLILFILVRIIIAITSTYTFVLNPVVYLEYVKGFEFEV
jgi:hypothetical protein